MNLVHDSASLQAQIALWQAAGKRWALVPTMGNLHAGHLGLVQQAQRQVDHIVVSIFVNPLQFGEGEDFATYPRSLTADCDALRGVGCDLVFCPAVTDIYPTTGAMTKLQAHAALAARFEGESRPGHFDGVVTVVAKLFNLVRPHLAVFGQKDYQQWRIVQAMVSDLNWPIQLLKAPIARDDDGLALSSRNQYLNLEQRQLAPRLYQTLQLLADTLHATKDPLKYWPELQSNAVTELLMAGFNKVDYLVWVEQHTLAPLKDPQQASVLLVAARLDKTRLLDNLEL